MKVKHSFVLSVILSISFVQAMKQQLEQLSDLSISRNISSPEMIAKTRQSWTLLFLRALQEGTLQEVNVLLSIYKDYNDIYAFVRIKDMRDAYGRTALMLAVLSGSFEKVQLVLTNVAPSDWYDYINVVEAGGWNAIVYANSLHHMRIESDLREREKLSQKIKLRQLKQEVVHPIVEHRKMCDPIKFTPLPTITEDSEEEKVDDE
jgi:hypothetical protein